MSDYYNFADFAGGESSGETPEERRLRLTRELMGAMTPANPGPLPPLYVPQDSGEPLPGESFITNAARAIPRGFVEGAGNTLGIGGLPLRTEATSGLDIPDEAFVAKPAISPDLPNPQGPGTGVGQAIGGMLSDPNAYSPGGLLSNPKLTTALFLAGHQLMHTDQHASPIETNNFANFMGGDSVTHTELQQFTPPDWLTSALQTLGPNAAEAAGGQHEGPYKPATRYSFISGIPTTPINSAGGPTEVKTSEIAILGGSIAATIGMAMAPRVFSRVINANFPRLGAWMGSASLRDVEHALPGTQTFSNVFDLMHTYHDVNAGVLNMLERAGTPAPVMQHITDTFRLQTRMGAMAIADSAVSGGHAETPNFRFQVDRPMTSLNQVETQTNARYLHLREAFDDINALDTQYQLNPRLVHPPGPTAVRGMTLQDVTREMHAIEHMDPTVHAHSDAFQANIKEVRNFAASGEYSLISRADRNELHQNRQNTVPYDAGDLIRTPERLLESHGGGRTLTYDQQTSPRGSPTNDAAEAMRTVMRLRMENEAKGMYIDAMNGQFPNNPIFKRVSTQEYNNMTARMRSNTVTMYRRGVKEVYSADPFLVDVLRMDPYYMTGMGGAIAGIYGTKRFMEMTTTGVLAPWFAVTSFTRNQKLARQSTAVGLSAPWWHQSVAAIPQQLYPQLQRAVVSSIERGGTAAYLGQAFGYSQREIDAFAGRLAMDYNSSLYARMQHYGSHESSFTQHQVPLTQQQNTAIQNLIQSAQDVSGVYGTTLRGLGRVLNAIHNAPGYAYARKNEGRIPLRNLTLETRRLTGDARTGGQFTADGRPIRFDTSDLGVTHTAAAYGAKLVGGASEIGRVAIPWFNPTLQGSKRVAEAYLNNPVRFITRLWVYSMLPAGASYLFSRSLGNDPNGLSYVDYMMNRRSDYMKTMNQYIPFPGRPAEDGFEIPRFQEESIAARLFESGIDHLYRSNVLSQSEDFHRAAQSFLDVTVIPPTPPLINAALGTMGIVGTGGMFSGEFYKRRTQAFDQNGGLPQQIELVLRALAPGIGDIIGSGAAAMIQTPRQEGGGIYPDKTKPLSAIGNALTEGGKRAVMKTPFLRNATDILPPMSGNTGITDELHKKQRTIKELEEYFKTWDLQGGLIGVKPRSKGGEAIARTVLGERMPSEAAGLNQAPPTNPLYLEFMKELHAKFAKDAPVYPGRLPRGVDTIDPNHMVRDKVTGEMVPRQLSQSRSAIDTRERKWQQTQEMMRLQGQDTTDPNTNTGGIGFLSLWNRYGIATRQLQRLRSINDGNNVTWQRDLDTRPGVREFLEKQGLDTKDLRQVRNFYEKVRGDAARVILFTIRGVEDDLSKRIGQPVKIEDIQPYGKGIEPQKGGAFAAAPTYKEMELPKLPIGASTDLPY